MRVSGLSVVLVAAVCAGCQSSQPPPAGASATNSPLRPRSTIREVMDSMVAPSAQGLWDSVGRVSDEKGTKDLEPRSDEEWAAVRRHAVALMETTNLLLIQGRHVARQDQQTLATDDAEPGSELPPAEIEKRITQNWNQWSAMTLTLQASAASMLDAIDKKDVARLERYGGDLDEVCESCHLMFWYPQSRAK